MMSFDEGCDYRKYCDVTLKELFEHTRSLAQIIRKYHDKDYLHLDIKPENVLIIPETKEHVLLFDFDSIVTLEELKSSASFRLSFSDGFSAPEQIQGKVKKIGFHTDIYSIGALVFYKLFDRKPVLNDCKISAQYDFSKMRYHDKRYQPKLYRKITEFLKKCLSVSTFSRWNNMEIVISYLDELINLSDIEGTFVYDSFQYNTGCFIGRTEEIEEIQDMLLDNQLVFLSGIGGIGKTEIAKRYALVNREGYDTIVFASYESSIVDFVNNGIVVNGIEQEDGEDSQAFFERKIDVLKEVLTPKDLIIIDNFDVDYDEQLERLFECPCKFIITTREDFRDYNYPQITIDKMDDIDDVIQLFTAYNNNCYSDSEWDAVKEIVEFVDKHTMTVELIAKYLRETEDSPIELYNRFLAIEGITNIQDIGIKQRKDRKLRAESVKSHLRILFDISNFTNIQEELIRSLSLLGYVRIVKNKFLDLCDVENNNSELEILIKRGWIEYNEITNKISLHQVILDLIYNDLHPNAENCPHIVNSMIDFVNSKTINYVEKQVKRKFLKLFMERLTGNNLLYAQLCVLYGKQKYIGIAEKICSDSSEHKALDLLQKIYRLKIKFVADCDDLFETEMELHDYYKHVFRQIGNLLDKVMDFCEQYSDDAEYVARNYTKIGFEVEEAITTGDLWGASDDYNEELDAIYCKIIAILDKAAENILTAGIPLDNKEKLLKKIQRFYTGDDFTAMYRCEHYTDTKKAFWYQEQIDAIRKQESDSDENCLYVDDVTNSMIAEEYEEKGDYDSAIEYYERAYENDEELYDIVLYNLSNVCKKAGYIEKAIAYLQCILSIDKEKEKNMEEYFSYTSYACCELIDLLLYEKRFSEAKELAYDLIHYNALNLSDEDNSYAVTWMIAANYKLFLIENKDIVLRENYWEECLKYYAMLDINESIPSEIYDFVEEYVRSLAISVNSMEEILKILKRIDIWQEGKEIIIHILNYAINICENKLECQSYHILFLIKYSMYMNDMEYSKYDVALEYCNMAQKFLEQYKLQDSYYQNLIYRALAVCMSNIPEYESNQIVEVKKKCDYILLTEREMAYCSDEERYEAWNTAASEYSYIDDYENELYCIEQEIKIILPILNQHEFSQYNNYWRCASNMISCYIKLGNLEKARQEIQTLYKRLLEHYCIEKESERNKHEYSNKVKELAEYCQRIKDFNAAIHMYLFAIYIALTPSFKVEIIRNVFMDESMEDVFYNEFKEAVQGVVSNDRIEQVINLQEKVLPLLQENTSLIKYTKLLKWFAAQYQHQEIEFKR